MLSHKNNGKYGKSNYFIKTIKRISKWTFFRLATPEKIVEMLASVADGKEEFVILSNGDEFLQTCLDKKKNNFHLEYSSGCFILEYLETTYNIF